MEALSLTAIISDKILPMLNRVNYSILSSHTCIIKYKFSYYNYYYLVLPMLYTFSF